MEGVTVWVEIAAERLAGNFTALRSMVREGMGMESAALLAVVKANAYGHGVDPCAAVLAAAGAESLGVTDAQEGARVRALLRSAEGTASQDRDIGQPEILVMSGTVGLAGEAECIAHNALTAVVWETSHVERLAKAARDAAIVSPLKVHLEVDSGMSRQGVMTGAALDAVLGAIAGERRITLDGVFTHFASTEVAGSEQTASQQARFEEAIAQVARSGSKPRWVHVGNSSYLDNRVIENAEQGDALAWLRVVAERLGARAMVRSGLALYGYVLPIEGPGRSLAAERIRPVMTWKTRVIGVREVQCGALVGYDGAFAAERTMRLALLPIGYADGLRRELSCTNRGTNVKAGGWVMVRGQRASIVGRVSMNLTTVDVSGIADVSEGDEVVVLGEGATADDHARMVGTIAYDILCGVRTRG